MFDHKAGVSRVSPSSGRFNFPDKKSNASALCFPYEVNQSFQCRVDNVFFGRKSEHNNMLVHLLVREESSKAKLARTRDLQSQVEFQTKLP